MADPEPKILMSQAEFARRRGVSKKTVTEWKGKGLLAMTADGKVDVEASEWNLDQRPASYRGGTAHRPVRTVPKPEPDPREAKAERAKPKPAEASSPRPSDGDEDGDPDPDAENLPTPEAIRRKENFLGLQRKQEFNRKQGQLVDRAAAEKLFFDTARNLRDAWANWPARIAVVMADELKVDARTLNTVLTAHVQQHLRELGEPEADLPRSREP
jgi:hypothetical protein